jgi:hypothetical protein
MDILLIALAAVLTAILILAGLIHALAIRKAAKGSIPRLDKYLARTR